jgi:hypothetical protein
VRLPAPLVRDVREAGRGLSAIPGLAGTHSDGATVRFSVGSGSYAFTVLPVAAPSHTGTVVVIVVIVLVVLVVLALVVVLLLMRRRRTAVAA